MRIVGLTETDPGEPRAAVTPESAARLGRLPGAHVVVQAGIGAGIRVPDEAYADAGAEVAPDVPSALADADVLLRVGPPTDAELAALPRGCVRAGFLDVFRGEEDVRRLAAAGAAAVSLELLPRTTRAQAMDALSSQHSLAGYAMAVLGADRLDRVLPMMVTPSGTLKPATVLVIGAGVAGLQAIATARRLGARVEAFDTRPDTREQVESLGARFVDVDLGDGGGEASGGYARELTDEQRRRQAEGLARHVATADVVITTAAVFGRPAPRIVTAEMVAGMRPGAVVVDYAASSGGNVEGTVPGEEIVTDGGVRIVGRHNYAALVARDASAMYANNLAAFVEAFHRGAEEPGGDERDGGADDGDDGDRSDGDGGDGGMQAAEPARCAVVEAAAEGDELAAGSLVTADGEIVHPLVRERMGLPPRAAAATPAARPDGDGNAGGGSDGGDGGGGSDGGARADDEGGEA